MEQGVYNIEIGEVKAYFTANFGEIKSAEIQKQLKTNNTPKFKFGRGSWP